MAMLIHMMTIDSSDRVGNVDGITSAVSTPGLTPPPPTSPVWVWVCWWRNCLFFVRCNVATHRTPTLTTIHCTVGDEGPIADISCMSIFSACFGLPTSVQLAATTWSGQIWISGWILPHFDVRTIFVAWKLKELPNIFGNKYFSYDHMLSKGVAPQCTAVSSCCSVDSWQAAGCWRWRAAISRVNNQEQTLVTIPWPPDDIVSWQENNHSATHHFLSVPAAGCLITRLWW